MTGISPLGQYVHTEEPLAMKTPNPLSWLNFTLVAPGRSEGDNWGELDYLKRYPIDHFYYRELQGNLSSLGNMVY
jgi:hypothetical protein